MNNLQINFLVINFVVVRCAYILQVRDTSHIHRKNILTGEGRNACHPKRTPLTQEEQPCLSTAHSMKVHYFQCLAYLRLRQFCRCLYQSVRPATLPPGTGRSHSLQPPVDLNSFHQLSQDERKKQICGTRAPRAYLLEFGVHNETLTFLCLNAEGEFLLLTVNPCRLRRSSTWRRNSALRCTANAATEMSSVCIGGILTGGGGGRRKTLFLRLSGRLTGTKRELLP